MVKQVHPPARRPSCHLPTSEPASRRRPCLHCSRQNRAASFVARSRLPPPEPGLERERERERGGKTASLPLPLPPSRQGGPTRACPPPASSLSLGPHPSLARAAGRQEAAAADGKQRRQLPPPPVTPAAAADTAERGSDRPTTVRQHNRPSSRRRGRRAGAPAGLPSP